MSETLRVYSTPKYGTRRHSRGIFKFLLNLFIVLILLAIILTLWLSRDSYPAENFIPKQTNFQIFSPRLMQNRMLLANTPLWNLVEPNSPAIKVKQLLSDQEQIPLWVVKHLIYDFFYFSINDLDTFNDYLIIVRLSRVGCVLETLFTLSHTVETDWAGGLNLKFLPDQKLYYTRKGRVLLLSPNRQTMINSITQDIRTQSETILSAEISKNQEKHLAWGTIKIPWENIKSLIPEVKFYIGLTETQLGVKSEATIHPDPEKPWTLLLAQLISKPIREPIEGSFSCAIDTGVPLKTWIRAFETIPTTTDILVPPIEKEISLLDWIKTFSPLVNNQFYLSLDGFYVDEIIPFMPKYCIVATTQPNICESLTQSLTRINVNILGENNKILPTEKANEFIFPMFGSSQTDLHINCSENQLIFYTNAELGNLLTEHLKSQISNQENSSSFILQLKPEKLITEFENSLLPLQESNIFKFRNPEKINNLFSKIKIFKEFKIKINLNQGQVKAISILNFGNEVSQTNMESSKQK